MKNPENSGMQPQEQKRAAADFSIVLFVLLSAALFGVFQQAAYYWPALGLSHRIDSAAAWIAAAAALVNPLLFGGAAILFAGLAAERLLRRGAGYLAGYIAAISFYGFLTVDLWTQQIFGAHARQYIPDLLDAARAGASANQFDFAGDREAIQNAILMRLGFISAAGALLLYLSNIFARLLLRRRQQQLRRLSFLLTGMLLAAALITVPIIQGAGQVSAAAVVTNQLPFALVAPALSGAQNSPPPAVRISALLPDPYGEDLGREEIQLQAADGGRRDLAGWSIENSQAVRFALSGELKADSIERITINGIADLFANDGDSIHLLDPAGLIVDSVRYPGSAVHRGSLITAERPQDNSSAAGIEAQMAAGYQAVIDSFHQPRPLDYSVKLAAGEQPSVVYLILESFRFDGLEKMMPQLAAARSGGLELRRHSSGTNTSHLGLFSLFYGRSPLLYDSALGAGMRAQVAETFAASGYQTAFYTSGDCRPWRKMGQFLNGESFKRFNVFGSANWTTWRAWPDGDKAMAEQIAEDLNNAAGRPQFIAAFFMSSHFPYAYPAEFEKHMPVGDTAKLFAAKGEETPENLLNRYRNAMLYLDYVLSGLLAKIDLSKTIVVITGDHGESIWDDGTLTHGSRASEIQTRVPAVIFGGGLTPAVIDFSTTHLDLFPTVLHIAAGRHLEVAGIQGRDLLDGGSNTAAAAAGNPILILPFTVTQPLDLILQVNDEKLLFHARLDRPEINAIGLIDHNGILTGRPAPAGNPLQWQAAIKELTDRFKK